MGTPGDAGIVGTGQGRPGRATATAAKVGGALVATGCYRCHASDNSGRAGQGAVTGSSREDMSGSGGRTDRTGVDRTAKCGWVNGLR